ncbi:MAG: phosphatidate cytidylyltransferase [Hyphomicrobium sp.]|jgi:phosphatidate cytidylyltransferase
MEFEPEGRTADELAPAVRGTAPAELIKRVLSGAGFGGLSLLLLWAGLLPFGLLVLSVSLLASWEWGRIVRGPGLDVSLIVHGAAVGAATLLSTCGFAALGIAVLVTGCIIVLALEFGQRPIVSATGVLYTGLPSVALLWLRGNEHLGFVAVLFIIVVVSVTDTAAFATGRLLGGPRLAPQISPNKTWSGFAGGLLGGVLTAAVFALFLEISPAGFAVMGFGMSLIAQAGDLAESALKRAFGVKDASNLIPGHGGFLDRVDGLVTASIAAAVYAFFVDPHAPARALLAGF